MKVLLSSSYKQWPRWDETKESLIRQGFSCVTPKDIDLELFGRFDNLSPEDALEGAKKYYETMKESDILYVLNFDGYVGNAMAQEIGYAKGLGKKIVLLEEPNEPFIKIFTDKFLKPSEFKEGMK